MRTACFVVARKPALLLLLPLCLSSAQSHGQATYYQCEDEWGQPVFSQRPCSDTAPAKEVQVQQKISGPITEQPAGSASQQMPNTQPAPESAAAGKWEKVIASNRKREVEREMMRREGKIEGYEEQRDEEIAALNREQSRAANNYAGAQWETALATEMNAVNSKYDAKVRGEERKLERLKDELDELDEILVQ